MPKSSKFPEVYVFAVGLALAVNICSWHFPFFWDTILTSTVTQYFYEHGFHHFIIPGDLDAGHPPLFYIYVTCFFKVVGRTLFSAHLAMLPFTILGIISFVRILKYFSFDRFEQFAAVILYFSIPAVLTQNMLVSYDAGLLSLYLAALAAFLSDRKFLFALILIGIAGISLRGLFCIAALSATLFFIAHKKNWFKWNLLMVPAVLFAAVWYYYHFTQTGWFFATPSAGWSTHRGMADPFGLLKNTVSIARCFFDLGILLLSLFSLFYVVQTKKLDTIILIWIIPCIVFSVLFLPFTNPINHRYYLVSYVLLLPALIKFLTGRKKIYFLLVSLILISSNFLVYPGKISNGWDCTVAHQSYFSLREQFNRYFEENKIDKTTIGTVFPMNASTYQTDLNNDQVRMMNVNGLTVDSIPYVLYSNIGNDFSDEQMDALQKWKVIKKESKGLVSMIFLQNPHFGGK